MASFKNKSVCGNVFLWVRKSSILHTCVVLTFCFFFQSLGRPLENVKVQGKSQDSISEEPPMSSDEQESQAGSMTTGLDWTMISSDSGTEGTLHLMTIYCLSNLQDNL